MAKRLDDILIQDLLYKYCQDSYSCMRSEDTDESIMVDLICDLLHYAESLKDGPDNKTDAWTVKTKALLQYLEEAGQK